MCTHQAQSLAHGRFSVSVHQVNDQDRDLMGNTALHPLKASWSLRVSWAALPAPTGTYSRPIPDSSPLFVHIKVR